MKRLFLLVVIALVIFVAIYRQRIYMLDPIASVTRDGVKQGGVRVMINYSNDILMDDKSKNQSRLYMVQNWDKTAKYSTGPLKCIQYLACMTDADQASGEKVVARSRGKVETAEAAMMTNKRVEFVDENSALVVVSLRP